MTYAEKLKDSRWQKRRLEIIERDKHRCQHCFSNQQPFHVHHKYYIDGIEPWEYEGKVLITLCAACHEIETLLYQRQLRAIENFKIAGFNNGFHCLACGEANYKIRGTQILCNTCGWDISFEQLTEWAAERIYKAKAP